MHGTKQLAQRGIMLGPACSGSLGFRLGACGPMFPGFCCLREIELHSISAGSSSPQSKQCRLHGLRCGQADLKMSKASKAAIWIKTNVQRVHGFVVVFLAALVQLGKAAASETKGLLRRCKGSRLHCKFIASCSRVSDPKLQ